MKIPLTNRWTQVLLTIALCFILSISFRASHMRKHLAVNAAQANVLSSAGIHSGAPVLNVTSIVQHGHIVEIKGSAEPGTVVMINGLPAATVFPGNTFRHFPGPLHAGTNVVSITCQNEQG